MIYRLLPLLMVVVVVNVVNADTAPLPRFDWTAVMEISGENLNGSQILHFNNSDKPAENSPEALAFISSYLQDTQVCESAKATPKFLNWLLIT